MRHGVIGGRWKILGRLGKGGFAEVFKVEDTRNPSQHVRIFSRKDSTSFQAQLLFKADVSLTRELLIATKSRALCCAVCTEDWRAGVENF